MSTPTPRPQPPQHHRLTFEGVFGTLVTPFEDWSMRVNLFPQASPAAPALADLTAMATAWGTMATASCTNQARLLRVKWAHISAAGQYVSDPLFVDVDIAGGVTTPAAYVPLSQAVAVTLQTNLRGPSGRGRFFLPAPDIGTVGLDGLMTAAQAQGFATRGAAFITAINNNAGLGSVCVASTKGFLTPVTGVKVGRVPDVIRSRREKTQEGYGALLSV